MLADIKADSTLSALNSTSKRAIFNLFTYIIATAIYLLEVLMDVFKTDVEITAASAAPASAAWLQNKVLQFQYDASTPQVVQLINFAPSYPTVDTTKQIISRAAVITTVAGQTIIKVATGTPPTALSSAQLSSLQDYVNIVGATVNYTVVSQNADELYVNGDIYYQGQYSAIIQETVITAINNYLANLDFNGVVKISTLEDAIQAVSGVSDVVLKNVAARQDSQSFISKTYLVQNQQLISRVWNTQAGYIISETTSGNTLSDTLNFVAV